MRLLLVLGVVIVFFELIRVMTVLHPPLWHHLNIAIGSSLSLWKLDEPKYDDIKVSEIQNLFKYTGGEIPINEKCKNIQKIMKTPVHRHTTVMWECSKDVRCTGLGDEIRNLVATFIYAVDRGHLFNIMWSKTYQVYPEILVPNLYDWRNKTTVADYKLIIGHFGQCDWDKPVEYIRTGSYLQFGDDKNCDAFKNAYTRDIINYWRQDYKPELRGCSFWALFKFGSYLKKRLAYHELLFKQWLDKKEYNQIISVQIRSGDDVMFGERGLKVTAIEIIAKFLKCARKLEKQKGFQKSVFFLTADSAEIRKAARANKDIFSPQISPKHVAFSTGKEVLTDALVEIIMMAKTDALVRSHSGYGISAEHLGLMEHTAVYPDCSGEAPEYTDYY